MGLLGAIAQAAELAPQSRQFADSMLLFNPIKLAGLIVWVYVCLYFVNLAEFSSSVPKHRKALVNFLTLFLGPIPLSTLTLTRIVKRYAGGSHGILALVRQDFSRAIDRLRAARFVGARSKSSVILFDSSGRSFSEVFGQGTNKKHAQNTLNLTTRIIWDAITQNASDILIDPKDESNYTVRFRVDGILRTVERMDADTCNAVINSIKAVASMDIAEKRRPQDGGFSAKIPDGTVAFRCASAGVLHGEKLSIRVLNQVSGMLLLQNIGLSQKHLSVLADAVARPSGMILVCGPTGSGKTTTVYALLNAIDFFSRNVITVEDPIEYVLPSASQIEVNPKADITFAKALRSILRQDPDVIFVGEIRDQETAGIALGVSQTGHLVLATMHSGSYASAIVRLLDLGISRLLLSSALSVVVSQRLVRRLCDFCKSPAVLTETQRDFFRRQKANLDNICNPVGCKHCNRTGYKGRIGIFDVVIVDDRFRKAIVDESLSAVDLKKQGEARGKSQLVKQGLEMVAAGATSLLEVKRVTSDLGA
jgi:type II secretory ATPase GspE/PulE/Tfp pilus assembly ATPase PilB-like protein